MPEIELHPQADDEMRAAAAFYEIRQADLGERFLSRIEAAFESILAHPLAYQIIVENYRRRLVEQFPYSIIYRTEADRIFVLAIAHWSRKPYYWRARG